jgi:hypothetical protein
MQPSFRVIKPHRAAFQKPLTARKGERLTFERRRSEWEGWLWCTARSGESGWVPESWVELEAESCILLRDYTAFELSVQCGELLTADLLESGWLWANKENGESGWVPLENLLPVSRSLTSYEISDADQAQMLRKLMLYWDGQWFLKTVELSGLEAAIDLNARVRTAFGRIEMRTLLRTLGRSCASDLLDAMRLLQTYAGTFMGSGLRAEFVPFGPHQAMVMVRRCAAFEGAKLAALPRVDQACIACETLWDAWLEVLLPGSSVHVQYLMRQGKGDPACQFVIQIGGTKEDT